MTVPRRSRSSCIHATARPTSTRALLDAALSDPELSGRRLLLWVFGADERVDEFTLPFGFAPERELRQMAVALPVDARPTWPDDVEVRPFRVGVDESPWLAGEQPRVRRRPRPGRVDQRDAGGARSRALVRSRPGSCSPGDGEALAGFCWTKLHPPSPPHEPSRPGEIYVIGVDPAHQGIGLGRALVLGGLEALHESGAEIGMLFVDAANRAAVGLYESLGFTTARIDRAYERPKP